MAKAAEDDVFLNKIQIALGVLGFGALLMTIHYSRMASAAAIKAANAAERAVDVASYAAERQLRAYISIIPTIATRIEYNRNPVVFFTIKNTGASPAYKLRYMAMVDILEHPLADHQQDLVTAAPYSSLPTLTIHPNGQITGDGKMDRALLGSDLDTISVKATHRLYVAGIAIYDDAFGHERKTKFCAYLDGPAFRNIFESSRSRVPGTNIPIDWIYSHVHNEAT